MKYIFTILLGLLCLVGQAQVSTDSIVVARPTVDSAALARAEAVRLRQDSIRNAFVQDSLSVLRAQDSARAAALSHFMRLVDSSRYNRHPYLRFTNPEVRIAKVRQWEGKELLFYGIVAVILLFGLLRNAFSRYLSDLFRTFFRTSIRQRLIKEQVANAPLPSLLFNILFLLSGALLVTLLLRHYGYGREYPLWQLYLYGVGALGAVYLTKFVVLKVFGWLLNAVEATNTYIFVVFAANKILGILILPFILGLAFTAGTMYEVFFALCMGFIGCMFVYRFYLSFLSVHKLMRINIFHFLLYLLAFEIVPLLLINKLLVQFFAQTP